MLEYSDAGIEFQSSVRIALYIPVSESDGERTDEHLVERYWDVAELKQKARVVVTGVSEDISDPQTAEAALAQARTNFQAALMDLDVGQAVERMAELRLDAESVERNREQTNREQMVNREIGRIFAEPLSSMIDDIGVRSLLDEFEVVLDHPEAPRVRMRVGLPEHMSAENSLCVVVPLGLGNAGAENVPEDCRSLATVDRNDIEAFQTGVKTALASSLVERLWPDVRKLLRPLVGRFADDVEAPTNAGSADSPVSVLRISRPVADEGTSVETPVDDDADILIDIDIDVAAVLSGPASGDDSGPRSEDFSGKLRMSVDSRPKRLRPEDPSCDGRFSDLCVRVLETPAVEPEAVFRWHYPEALSKGIVRVEPTLGCVSPTGDEQLSTCRPAFELAAGPRSPFEGGLGRFYWDENGDLQYESPGAGSVLALPSDELRFVVDGADEEDDRVTLATRVEPRAAATVGRDGLWNSWSSDAAEVRAEVDFHLDTGDIGLRDAMVAETGSLGDRVQALLHTRFPPGAFVERLAVTPQGLEVHFEGIGRTFDAVPLREIESPTGEGAAVAHNVALLESNCEAYRLRRLGRMLEELKVPEEEAGGTAMPSGSGAPSAFRPQVDRLRM